MSIDGIMVIPMDEAIILSTFQNPNFVSKSPLRMSMKICGGGLGGQFIVGLTTMGQMPGCFFGAYFC